MTIVILGHRGVGKTQLLKRWSRYQSSHDLSFIDLDLEIEKRKGKSIRQLFLQEGEAAFREIEREVFYQVSEEHKNAIISVGAGFPVGIIPETSLLLWVRRRSDAAGRIFLDRPRLEKELSPLQEFFKRARVREIHFKNVYDKVYLMPEGLRELDPLEEEILVKKARNLGGAMTLLEESFFKGSRWHTFIESYAQRGVQFFEIRDDFLTHEQIQIALGSFFSDHFIYSFRRPGVEVYPTGHQISYYDWALELGPMPEPVRFLKQRLIVSLHERHENESFHELLDRLNAETGRGVHLKLAPLVKSFEELLLGYEWQQEDPDRRSFLPRSENSRWNWFRRWMKGRQLLNFWCESDGSASDQPSLYEWLATPLVKSEFAAVLGSPVMHSWTPVEQRSFFEERAEPVFAIPVEHLEWDRALAVLTRLGLRHAAVTAPLKEEAYHSCQQKTDEAEALRSVNTLLYDKVEKQWHGQNTDLAGFRALTHDLSPTDTVVLWGGGGTLRMMKRVLPQAVSFSATRREVREEDRHLWSLEKMPDVVIWAAPRSEQMQWPLSDWKPKKVIDLNYAEDSPGREYAQQLGVTYVSGVKMFEVQAQHQRDFWETEK